MKNVAFIVAALLAVSSPSAVQAADPALTTLSEQGDAKKGKRVFIQCQACHSLTADGPKRVGPGLYGIFGRKVGGDDGYTRYSDALKNADFAWTEESLDAFLTDPNSYLPGVQATMRVRKVRKEQDRKDILAFLRQATQSAD